MSAESLTFKGRSGLTSYRRKNEVVFRSLRHLSPYIVGHSSDAQFKDIESVVKLIRRRRLNGGRVFLRNTQSVEGYKLPSNIPKNVTISIEGVDGNIHNTVKIYGNCQINGKISLSKLNINNAKLTINNPFFSLIDCYLSLENLSFELNNHNQGNTIYVKNTTIQDKSGNDFILNSQTLRGHKIQERLARESMDNSMYKSVHVTGKNDYSKALFISKSVGFQPEIILDGCTGFYSQQSLVYNSSNCHGVTLAIFNSTVGMDGSAALFTDGKSKIPTSIMISNSRFNLGTDKCYLVKDSFAINVSILITPIEGGCLYYNSTGSFYHTNSAIEPLQIIDCHIVNKDNTKTYINDNICQLSDVGIELWLQNSPIHSNKQLINISAKGLPIMVNLIIHNNQIFSYTDDELELFNILADHDCSLMTIDVRNSGIVFSGQKSEQCRWLNTTVKNKKYNWVNSHRNGLAAPEANIISDNFSTTY